MQTITYPDGTWRKVNDGPFNCSFFYSADAKCEDGKVRRVRPSYDGIADTFFSVPATVSVWVPYEKRNVSVSGYLTTYRKDGSSVGDPDGLKFVAYAYGKNGHYLNEEYHELSICEDCLVLIANGDTSGNSRCETEEGEAEYIAECEHNWPSNEWFIALGSIDCEYCGRLARSKDDTVQDCEGWFTHSGCDYCDSNLGGTKYHAVAIKEKKVRR